MAPAPKARKASRRVDRRKTTSTRITPEARARLELAAAQSGRSLAQEIEFCIERTFDQNDARIAEFGDRQTYELMRMMAGARHIVETTRGQSWFDDSETYRDAWGAILFVAEAFDPARRQQDPSASTAVAALSDPVERSIRAAQTAARALRKKADELDAEHSHSVHSDILKAREQEPQPPVRSPRRRR